MPRPIFREGDGDGSKERRGDPVDHVGVDHGPNPCRCASDQMISEELKHGRHFDRASVGDVFVKTNTCA